MAHIAILVHEHDNFERTAYFLREIAAIWRESKIRISVSRGVSRFENADLAILHVDLTVIPPEYLALARRYPIALNARVADISKRLISRHLVSRGDGYDGPVIVKTNRNWGGIKEGHLAAKGLMPQSYVCEPGKYPIFLSPAKVPPAFWDAPELIVERFISEQRDGMFCLRTWVFLGDRETNSLSYAKEPIIKSSNVIRREVVPDVPDELRRTRHEMGFDFGKFDYAIVNGKVVLYDVNRTPSL